MLEKMIETGDAPGVIVEREGLKQESDSGAIEAAWASAPENEREGMLNEMNSLRQQGFTLILAEIQRMQSQPESTTVQRVSPGTLQLTPSTAAPASAPAAPVVFQSWLPRAGRVSAWKRPHVGA